MPLGHHASQKLMNYAILLPAGRDAHNSWLGTVPRARRGVPPRPGALHVLFGFGWSVVFTGDVRLVMLIYY